MGKKKKTNVVKCNEEESKKGLESHKSLECNQDISPPLVSTNLPVSKRKRNKKKKTLENNSDIDNLVNNDNKEKSGQNINDNRVNKDSFSQIHQNYKSNKDIDTVTQNTAVSCDDSLEHIFEKKVFQSPLHILEVENITEQIINMKKSNLGSKKSSIEKQLGEPRAEKSEEVVNDVLIMEKTREEIKAEREAKKLAKQLKKIGVKSEKAGDTKCKDIKIKPQEIERKKSQEVEIKPQEIELKSQEAERKPQEHGTKPQELKAEPTKEDSEINKEPSKAEKRAERRAKQEAQRAAKENLTSNKTHKSDAIKKPQVSANNDAKIETKKPICISENLKSKPPQVHHKVKLFNHLYVEKEKKIFIPLNSKEVHPAIVRLGVQYSSHIVIGSNARCIALLNALKKVVQDYSLPAQVEFSRGFEAHLRICLKFLNSCRPLAVSMHNAIKHIKWQLTQFPNNIAENDGKLKICEAIDVYIKDQIEVAGKAISLTVKSKITNDDVILTFGCSSLIESILIDAAEDKNFRVVIVEAHPRYEGREMLRRLTVKGIRCSLVMISALSFVMREITKVVLGAGALLANGYVMARVGTAQVAMVAHAYNVPVLVCCETHKFSERVQTDSFVYNEIDDPDDLVKSDTLPTTNLLNNWRSYSTLTPLNLFYDVTPPDLVTAVVTELAVLPCTSVPVILRIKPTEFQ